MVSLILATATRFLLSLLLLLPVFLLIRGHNEPGGGFVAGLVAATAFILCAIAFDLAAARKLLQVHPRVFIGVGLIVAMGSGLLPVLVGQPFLTGRWADVDFPLMAGVKLGTPLLFDIGVFLVVFGAVLTIIFPLMEE